MWRPNDWENPYRRKWREGIVYVGMVESAYEAGADDMLEVVITRLKEADNHRLASLFTIPE